MARLDKIALVGAGRLAGTLAVALRQAGYEVDEIITRKNPASLRRARSLAKKVGARAISTDHAALNADIVWFCVPDREIAGAASALSRQTIWKGKVAFHASGALAGSELDLLRRRGAAIASVHPLMTFVRGSKPSLKAVPFAIEGDRMALRAAQRIVGRLGGHTFPIPAKHKALYHAWGTFISPLLIALLASAEQIAHATGLSAKNARHMTLPIAAQTLANYARLGPAAAFSGPIVRGDDSTLRMHLAALKNTPEIEEVYVALAKAALRYLPAENRGKLKKLLASRVKSR